MTTHVFIYCRVSSKKQVTEGNGLEAQEAACITKAEKMGYTIAGIYKEPGVTGCAEKRPELDKMFSDITQFRKKTKTARIVVMVDEVGRLARALDVHFALKTRVEQELRGKIEFVKHKFDDSPQGKALEAIYSVFAGLERDVNRERVIEKMRARFEKGVDVYGRAKMGYVFRGIAGEAGNIQTPHRYNAPIIADALKRFAYSELTSVKQVKEYLDANKLIHEQGKRKGELRQNSLTTVKHMLRNAYFYAGFIKNEKNSFELRQGMHEALIDIETLKRIEDKLGLRSDIYQKASEDQYILKGWVVCDECGQKLTSNGQGSRGNTKYYHYYYCRNWNCPNKKKGIPPHIMHEDFEVLLMGIRSNPELLEVCEQIVKQLWKERIVKRRRASDKAREKLGYVEQQMDDLVRQLTRLTNGEDDFIVVHIKKQLNALNAEKVILEAEANQKAENDYDMEELVWRVNTLFGDPFLLWRRANLDDKRTMLNLLFPEKLRYKRGGGFRKAGNPLIYGDSNAYWVPIGGLVVEAVCDQTVSVSNSLISRENTGILET